MKRTFSSLLMMAALAVSVGLAACSTVAGGAPPNVAAIQNACAFDTGLRPTVDVLLAVPGLATVQERAAVVTARAVIDPVCADPTVPLDTAAAQAFNTAAAHVVGLMLELKARKGEPPPAPPAGAASHVSLAQIPRAWSA